MKLLLPLLLCMAGAALARTYHVYIPEGASQQDIEPCLAPLREAEPDAKWTIVTLSAESRNLEQARHTAQAIADGVSQLPCIALSDKQGCYACLPLSNITPKQLKEAKQLALSPDRASGTARREFEAKRYLYFAGLTFEPPTSPEACLRKVSMGRRLLQHNTVTTEDRQLITLRALYPLLMHRYAMLYQGAHTPASEAALLEAIAVLEEARDMAPTTHLGRQAYEERERLRAARLKSRQYE